MRTSDKFLITGITSIHGWPIFTYFQKLYPGKVLGVKNRFAQQPVESAFVTSADIEDYEKLQSICRSFQPTCIIHCAGLCDLDVAEDHPERAYQLNVQGALNIYEAGKDCKMVYISYDLIFSGKTNQGQGYTEEDIPDPLTVVGKTIIEAEKVLSGLKDHLILRLALPMGPSVQGTKGAVDWINSRFKKNRPATLLYDEVRSTINTEDIGIAVNELMLKECHGILNLGSPYTISLFGIGECIIKANNYPQNLLQGKFRHQFPPSPPRMGNVSLNSSKAHEILGWKPREWIYCPG